MHKQKIFFYLPRMLAVIFILFISLFAFDTPVFSIGFLMHLIPSFVVAVVLIFAWKKPKVGGYGFLVLGIVFTIFFKTYENIYSFCLLTLPLAIIGILFLAEKYTNS